MISYDKKVLSFLILMVSSELGCYSKRRIYGTIKYIEYRVLKEEKHS